MNVLLADDDNAMRLYFTKFLEKRGFTVTPCSNGKDAWEEFQKSPFNLVLLYSFAKFSPCHLGHIPVKQN